MVSAQPTRAGLRATHRPRVEAARALRLLRDHEQQPGIAELPSRSETSLAPRTRPARRQEAYDLGALRGAPQALRTAAASNRPLGVPSLGESTHLRSRMR